MAMSNEARLAIKAKLKLGHKPKDVAEEFGVKLPTIYAINRQLQDEIADETISELTTIPQEVVQHVVKEAKEKAPEIAKQFEAVEVGIDGLKKLDMKFQETVTLALNRFDTMLRDDNTALKDIVLITNTTTNAYEKVFNSGTNIHIGDNNNHSTQQLTVFKNKMGV